MGLEHKSLTKPHMNYGGMVHGGSYGGGSMDEEEYTRLRFEQGGRTNPDGLADLYDRTGNMRVARTLAKYQTGGTIEPLTIGQGSVPVIDTNLQGFDLPMIPVETEEIPADPGFDGHGLGEGLMDLGTTLLNVGPNVANIRDYRNLPGIQAPSLERTVNLEEPQFDDIRQAIISQGRNATNRAEYDSVQPGSAQAGRAQALAQTNQALSRLAGEEGRAKVQTRNTEARINQQTQARNLARVNQHYRDQTEREFAKVRGIAGERGAIGRKLLGSLGDVRRRSLDNDRMGLIHEAYNQFGTLQRAQEEALKSGNIALARQLGYDG